MSDINLSLPDEFNEQAWIQSLNLPTGFSFATGVQEPAASSTLLNSPASLSSVLTTGTLPKSSMIPIIVGVGALALVMFAVTSK